MSQDYLDILENADQLRKDFENQPRALEHLSGIVTDLYVDNHKFKGHNVRAVLHARACACLSLLTR